MIVSAQPRARRGAAPSLLLPALLAVVLCASHAPLLSTPFYWDELGQFVPAALDIWRDGAWVPHSAVPNSHPPGVMAYAAAVWSIFGYSIPVTRAAMLALAAAAVLSAFLLAAELSGGARGAPVWAAAFLCASPLFFSQAMLVQLDMPAMLLTSMALLFFLRERLWAAAAVATALVLVKESGAAVPAVLGGWLFLEGRRRDALVFAVPFVPLAAWLAFLRAGTGHVLGDAAYTEYNLFYLLHPVRLPMAFLRRLHYLFVADFHWVGTVALVLAFRRTPLFRSRGWRVAAALAGVHIVLLSVIGGAVHERYLLPVLPLTYAAMALALRSRPWAGALMLAGLAAGNFWNPPHPFPPENTLAWVDFVRVHREAAEFLERRYPDATIAAAWPLAPELQHPEFGYVHQAMHTRLLPDQVPETIRALDWNRTPVLALFSHKWDPAWSWFRLAPVRWLWSRYWGHREDIREPGANLPVKAVTRFERGGWWVEIYEAEGRVRGPAPE